jgi:hypothetical protein
MFSEVTAKKSIQAKWVETEISVESIHNILRENMNTHYLCQLLVPKILTPECKEAGMTLGGDLIILAKQHADIWTWCFLYYPQPK